MVVHGNNINQTPAETNEGLIGQQSPGGSSGTKTHSSEWLIDTTLRTLRRTHKLSLSELSLLTSVPMRHLIAHEYDGQPLSPSEQQRVATLFGIAPNALQLGFASSQPEEKAQAISAVDDEQPSNPSIEPTAYTALLRNSNFRRLWAGQALSTFGSYFTRVAIPVYVFSLTNSYAQLGFAAFSSLVASLLFGLFAGALADRWDRRRVMIGADLSNTVILLMLLAVIMMPMALPFKLGCIYAVNFAAALLRELFNPARVALFADVVPESDLLRANSLDQATTTFCELLSYPVAGFALFYLGPAIAIGVDALTFLASALLIWSVSTRNSASQPGEASTIWQQIREGLRYAKQVPIVRKIVILSLVMPLLMSLLNTLQLPFAVEALGSTKEVGFPALEGAMALGFVIGVLLLGRYGQSISRTALLAYGIGSYGLAMLMQGLVPIVAATTTLATSTSHGPWTVLLIVTLPFAILAGAANSLVFTCIRTVLQEETPRPLVGRVASVVSVAAGAGFSLGALLTGMGQGRAAWMITISGVLIVALGLLFRWWLPTNPRTSLVNETLMSS